MRSLIKNLFRNLGFDIKRFPEKPLQQIYRELIINAEQVACVYDVGASDGLFGRALRAEGFSGIIHSFEPQAEAYQKLQEVANRESRWFAHPVALGSRDETLELNIAGNRDSSSILPMADKHVSVVPESAYERKERVEVRRLDRYFDKTANLPEPAYMKLDTQGYELEALIGSEGLLDSITAMQLEVSLQLLYEGQPKVDDLFEWIKNKGYRLLAVDRGFTDVKTGEVLQLECIFARRDYPY